MTDANWRVILPEKRSGYLSQSIVEALMIRQNEDLCNPTLYFYQWDPHAVAIGTFQKLKEACNEENCKKHKVDIVRRMTGGGSVYLHPEHCFTYSLIAPSPILPKDIRKSYHMVCSDVASVLREFSIPAEFKPVNDIFAEGRKISGNVQTWRGNSVMVGGTILMDLDLDLMNDVLIYDRKKLAAKGITDPFKSVTCVREYSDVSQSELVTALSKRLCKNTYEFGSLSQEELSLAKALEKEKYRSSQWIRKR